MLRWIDGFEHYGHIDRLTEGIGGGAAWSEVNTDGNGWILSTDNPATGTYHLRLRDAALEASYVRRIFGVASQVVGHGYRFAVEDLPTFEATDPSEEGALVLAGIRDVSNATHFIVYLGTDGSVFAKHGGGTIMGRSDPCVAAGGYHHFELKTKIDNTTGYLEIRINEVTVLNLTGIDTQNTANATAAQFIVGRQSGALVGDSVGYINFDLDDPFAWDDDAGDATNTVVDFVGNKGAIWLPPTSDTATSEFTITGSVTAYGAVDEVPPSGTEYLENADGTARTILGIQALPANVAEVIAFMPLIYVREEETGTAAFRAGLVVNGDETYGPTDDPSTEYAYLRPGPKTIDPDTGVAWANTAAPQLLIERTA